MLTVIVQLNYYVRGSINVVFYYDRENEERRVVLVLLSRFMVQMVHVHGARRILIDLWVICFGETRRK